jgi:leucyl-tRNA synthetase
VSPDGTPRARLEAAYVDDGINVHSGEFDGLTTPECKRAVVERLQQLGRGAPKVTYRLRDWIFSRLIRCQQPSEALRPKAASGLCGATRPSGSSATRDRPRSPN